MPSDKSRGIDQLVDLLHQSENSIRVTNDLKKRHYGPITGVIVEVNDPASKGRVRVKLDSFRHTSIVEEWLPVCGAFQGFQPRQLIGQKVLIAPIEGSVHLYRIIGLLDGDIGTFDPNTDAGEFDHNIDSYNYRDLQDLKQMSARTGFMHRLPIYSIPAGDNLPVCHAGNHGANIIIDDGLNSFQLTCLRYKGGYGWVTHQRQRYNGDFRSFTT